MKLIEEKKWIEWKTAVESGISSNTLKRAKALSFSSFQFMDDPEPPYGLLVCFDTMKDQYKEKVLAFLSHTILLSHLEPDHAARTFFSEYKLNDGTGLPQQHIEQYTTAAQWLNLLVNAKDVCKKTGLSKEQFLNAAIALIEQKKVDLPCSVKKLYPRIKEYKEQGYRVLISKKFGNNNSEKLTEEAKQWLIAQYASPLKLACDTTSLTLQYLSEAAKRGWDQVTEQCVYAYLHRADVEPLWWLGKHGWKSWRLRYEHKNRIVPPSFRDALWEGDGTKLNFFTSGFRAELNMYFVVDVHSEMILGYDFSNSSEDFTVQQRAFKRALKKSGHKPYQVLYDNQGGHKGAQAKHFFNQLAKVHFAAKPYNAESKHIERIIGRFQKQVMSQYWFFTGMNVTTKSEDSKVNKDFYDAHKSELPSVQEIIRIAESCVEEWNNRKHPRFDCTRAEQYASSINAEAQPVSRFDMVELFYNTTEEITYYPGGIKPVIKGRKDLQYEVTDSEGNPDLSLIRDRFVVKYDADDLSHIYLYKRDATGDLRFVAIAYEKDGTPRAVADMREGDQEKIRRRMKVREQQRQTTEDALEDIRAAAGWSVDDIIRAGELAPKELKLKAESIYLSGDEDDEIKIAED